MIFLIILFFVSIMLVSTISKKGNELQVGDPTWDGTFPCEAPEFCGPAYVYEDGVESPLIRFDVPIVGYRVAPEVIVSVDFGFRLSAFDAQAYAQRKHGRLPESKDLKALLENWDAVKSLKENVEDVALPDDFWVVVDGRPEVFFVDKGTVIKEDARFYSARLSEAVILIDR